MHMGVNNTIIPLPLLECVLCCLCGPRHLANVAQTNTMRVDWLLLAHCGRPFPHFPHTALQMHIVKVPMPSLPHASFCGNCVKHVKNASYSVPLVSHRYSHLCCCGFTSCRYSVLTAIQDSVQSRLAQEMPPNLVEWAVGTILGMVVGDAFGVVVQNLPLCDAPKVTATRLTGNAKMGLQAVCPNLLE